MKLLVTAFNAFGSESLNAAQLVLQRLPRSLPSGAAQLHTLLVPTEFAACAPLVERNILRLQPDAVLLLGQAAGRRGLTPERIAINLDDARIPDNAGLQPTDRPIVPEGPAAYFSTLPVKAITAAIQAQGVPASVSNSAGTFVCNHLMYCVLHFLRDRPQIRAGFLHLPPTPLQAAALQVASPAPLPSLSTEDSLRGVLAALQVIADTQQHQPASQPHSLQP